MKSFLTAILLFTFILCLGVSVSQAQISVGIIIGAPPAPRIVAVTPVRPGPDFVWVEGYWYPVGHHYKWHAGYWTRPPYEGAHWVGPHHDGERYFAGYWDGNHGRFEHDHHWDHDHDRDFHGQDHDHGNQ
jgi:hypothetical protein